MRKKAYLTMVVVGLCVVSTANHAASTGSISPCSNRKQQAMNKMVNGASEVYDQTIQTPDLNFIEQCLKSIRTPQFGFGMGLPSIQGIMSKVCNMMKSQISSATSGINYNFNTNGFGNGFGSGVPTRQVSYSGNAGSFGDQLGQSMGMGSVSQPPSFSGAPSQADTTNATSAPVSNSSYMNTTVNSAMQYLTGK